MKTALKTVFPRRKPTKSFIILRRCAAGKNLKCRPFEIKILAAKHVLYHDVNDKLLFYFKKACNAILVEGMYIRRCNVLRG